MCTCDIAAADEVLSLTVGSTSITASSCIIPHSIYTKNSDGGEPTVSESTSAAAIAQVRNPSKAQESKETCTIDNKFLSNISAWAN